jgi:uncharacterized protein DUF5994
MTARHIRPPIAGRPSTARSSTGFAAAPVRGSLRLRMGPARTHRGALDGIWWPYTARLAIELPALIAGLDAWLDMAAPGHGQHVSGLAVDLTMWYTVPTRVEVAGRRIPVAWLSSIDDHTASASYSTVDHLDLLVIPPDTPYGSAKAAMAKAADGRSTPRGNRILAELTATPSPAPTVRKQTDTSPVAAGDVNDDVGTRTGDASNGHHRLDPLGDPEPGEVTWRLLDDGDPDESDTDPLARRTAVRHTAQPHVPDAEQS